MSAWPFLVWMLAWVGVGAAILYVGYIAFVTSEERKRIAAMPKRPVGPDPIEELERINTEMARIATSARQTLESARESVSKGLRG